ncbi:MAG: hypothetical protein QOC81_275 [Thermoanaerobaculia bacterium]|jgi:hypothetical protein|nr:hypothetical protein [Thermoanaerobaculia bacterium]
MPNERHPSRTHLHLAILTGALFLALRVPLLVVRAPFFDELFTRWIAGKSFVGILAALRIDSGPPLYYFIVHMLGDPSIEATRVLSLLFSTISIVAILRSNRVAAALLMAVFPPSILFAADARAYAICAMFVTIAVLAIDEDRPLVSAIALVLAAYSHYYGVLFFPILLVTAAGPAANQPAGRRRYAWRPRFAALGLAVVLFIPGFILALKQPTEARAWMTTEWPDALFVRPPLALVIIGAVAVLVSARLNRYLLMVVVPLILAIALRVYVPMRFEAVLAAPLALWLGESLRQNRFRILLMTALIGVGIAWSAIGIVEHASRPPDPFRQAAQWVSRRVLPNQNVVASGYCYLETLMNGHSQLTAFPPEQREHPGWRALPRPGLTSPRGAFFWIGERNAPELGNFVRERRNIQPLFINDRAMVALVR